jgi:hypothetical protein
MNVAIPLIKQRSIYEIYISTACNHSGYYIDFQ